MLSSGSGRGLLLLTGGRSTRADPEILAETSVLVHMYREVEAKGPQRAAGGALEQAQAATSASTRILKVAMMGLGSKICSLVR